VLALLLNLFFPGVGTIVLGGMWLGIIQFLVYVLGAALPAMTGGLTTVSDAIVAVVCLSALAVSVGAFRAKP
jgi:hypothetical protein